MTDADLQAIERRHEGRTQGPLRTYDRIPGGGLMAVGPDDGGHGVAAFVRLEDAGHFVFAGADIDALLAEVRFLRRVICDMEDDGKGAAACECYRRALEAIWDGRPVPAAAAEFARAALEAASR